MSRRLCLGLLAVISVWGQARLLPLDQVKAGMRGTGKTVFSGSRVEEFDVEVLGILENSGPKQSIILGRLSGGPLAHSGVMQGMSGSPVYVDGRLMGAVAMAFQFSKDPIAGIRPIEEMLAAGAPSEPVRTARAPDLLHGPIEDKLAREAGRMVEIATPISFGGFSQRTIDEFAPKLRAVGLEPRQGVLGGGSPSGRTSDIEPGSMISVQLVAGDLQVGADGTVTHIDGNRIYAFGHRFLSIGPTEMPFAKAEVLTLLPNLATSFKISAAREWAGAITADRDSAVAGELGRQARMVPVSVRVKGAREHNYRMQMVHDRLLTPFLLAMAVHSSVEATERSVGVATLRVATEMKFASAAPVKSENVWAGEAGVSAMAALGTATPLSFAMQSGFPEFQIGELAVEIDVAQEKRQYQLDQVWVSKPVVRPGDTVDVHAVLTGPGGREITRRAAYRVPVGALEGKLNLTVADAASTNAAEYMHLLGQAPGSAVEVRDFLNGLRPNNAAYLRVWKPEPSYLVGGRVVADPPASMALIFRRTQPVAGSLGSGSKIAEVTLDAVDGMVAGSKTVQVEIKQ